MPTIGHRRSLANLAHFKHERPGKVLNIIGRSTAKDENIYIAVYRLIEGLLKYEVRRAGEEMNLRQQSDMVKKRTRNPLSTICPPQTKKALTA
ncbi:hypothetical protein [Desulfotalea psychrophila]|uniref:Uncharacterized protein n=1 Tax=Desulfotalea psychrophila (strain LSv54 / DSM 12343) TaxID=177439 RepID=Q6AIF6_DESPS|nr:hypothetical protein [Desulfotalea psychrophila]CAG37891.1 unknown protein [Desulfotalea psychrophila LSv54]